LQQKATACSGFFTPITNKLLGISGKRWLLNKRVDEDSVRQKKWQLFQGSFTPQTLA